MRPPDMGLVSVETAAGVENAPQTPVFTSNRRQYRDLTANGEGANRITAHVGRYSDLP